MYFKNKGYKNPFLLYLVKINVKILKKIDKFYLTFI
nr:MAG TPA: hypothetical protein [Caudoviricetes sp.]